MGGWVRQRGWALVTVVVIGAAGVGQVDPGRVPFQPLSREESQLYRESLRLLGIGEERLLPLAPGAGLQSLLGPRGHRDPLAALVQICRHSRGLLEDFVNDFKSMLSPAAGLLGASPAKDLPFKVREAADLAGVLALLGVEGPRRWQDDTLPPEVERLLLELTRRVAAALVMTRQGLGGWTGKDAAQVLRQATGKGEGEKWPDPARLEMDKLLGAARVLLEIIYDWRINRPRPRFPAGSRGVGAMAGYEGDIRLVQPTRWGDIVLGGPGISVYRKSALLILDTGGDDLYLGAAGAAAPERPVSVLFDLGGNDLYRAGRGPALGAALAGTAALVDLGQGRDIYLGGECCQGAAVAGFGLLYDDGGDNLLRAGLFAQGAACLGVGMLFPGVGDDLVSARGFCQGAAGPGGMGLLLDFGGDDLYQVILTDGDTFARLAQGAAVGRTSGKLSSALGLLLDRQGRDIYLAGDGGQGVGRMNGVGLLLDLAGDDLYRAGATAQGAGQDLGLGLLLDDRGDDQYQAGDRSQGVGRLQGVGLFLDRAGNDRYRAGRLAQGAGADRGCGLLWDLGGADSRVADRECQGWAGTDQGLGLLLDYGGTDDHSSGLVDGGCLTRGQLGLAWDLGGEAAGKAPAPGDKEKEDPLPAKVDPTRENLAKHFHLALAARKGTTEWRRQVAILKGMGGKALPWLFDLALAGPGGEDAPDTAWQLLEQVARPHSGESAAILLGRYDALEDDFRRLLALRLLGRLGAEKARPRLEAALAGRGFANKDLRHLFRRTAARALARIGRIKMHPAAAELGVSKHALDRMAAAALLGGTAAKAALEPLLDLALDKSWRVRQAAAEALVRRGEAAGAAVMARLDRVEEEDQLHLVRLLGRLRYGPAAARLVFALDRADPPTAWTIARALARIGDPKASEEALEKLAGKEGSLFEAARKELGQAKR